MARTPRDGRRATTGSKGKGGRPSRSAATGKRSTAPGPAKPEPGKILRAAVPTVRRRRAQGLAAVVGVAGSDGSGWEFAAEVLDLTTADEPKRPPGSNGLSRLGRSTQVQRLARLLAALGSSHRLRILAKLLQGPATYQALAKTTGLKAGPLYHHIGELRLAGLIGPRERDLYELTRGGRNVTLAIQTLPNLAKDRRRWTAEVL